MVVVGGLVARCGAITETPARSETAPLAPMVPGQASASHPDVVVPSVYNLADFIKSLDTSVFFAYSCPCFPAFQLLQVTILTPTCKLFCRTSAASKTSLSLQPAYQRESLGFPLKRLA